MALDRPLAAGASSTRRVSCGLIDLGGRVDFPTAGEGAFDLPLKVFKEVGPARGMLWFDETALVCAVI